MGHHYSVIDQNKDFSKQRDIRNLYAVRGNASVKSRLTVKREQSAGSETQE